MDFLHCQGWTRWPPSRVMFAKKRLNSFPVRDNDLNLRASAFKVLKASFTPLHPRQMLHNSVGSENSSWDAAFLSRAPSFSAPACYLAQSLWSSACDIYTLWATFYLPVSLSTQRQTGPDTSGCSRLAAHQGHWRCVQMCRALSSVAIGN